MDIYPAASILTSILFFGYTGLWKWKHVQLNKSDKVDANAISVARTPLQRYFKQLQKWMKISCGLLIILHALPHTEFPGVTPYPLLNVDLSKGIGFSIGLIGLALCRLAQVSMGRSWRVGIDDNAKLGLITHGIYKYVRNPTYSGLFLLCAGVVLINPTALFLLWVLAFFLMMEFQVRSEEEYLLKTYGEEYALYTKKTKRYIPLIY